MLTETVGFAMTLSGGFILSPFDDIISQYIQRCGEWESIHIQIVKELIPSGPDVLYLDIGANFGVWTVSLANHVKSTGVVISFEDHKQLSMLLAGNIAINELKNVHVVNTVPTDKKNFQKTGLVVETVVTSTNVNTPIKSALVTSPSFTLSDYHSEFLGRCPDFIRLDISNNEFRALKGGYKMLSECKPVLLIRMDCYHLNKSVILLLDKLGFAMAWLFAPVVNPAFSFGGNDLETILINRLQLLTGYYDITFCILMRIEFFV